MHLFRCGYRSYRVGFLVRMFVFFSNRYVLFPDFFNQSSISFAFSSLQIILTLPYFRASGTYLSETSNRPSLHLSSQSCCHQVSSFRSQYLPLGWQILDRNRRVLPTRRSQNTFSISNLSPFSIAQPLLFYICPRRKMWRVKRVKDLWLRGLNSTQRNLETISRLSLIHSHI